MKNEVIFTKHTKPMSSNHSTRMLEFIRQRKVVKGSKMQNKLNPLKNRVVLIYILLFRNAYRHLFKNKEFVRKEHKIS